MPSPVPALPQFSVSCLLPFLWLAGRLLSSKSSRSLSPRPATVPLPPKCGTRRPMAYLLSYNSGASLRAFPGLFALADCNPMLLQNASLVGPIAVAVTTLPAFSPHFANVTVVHKEAAHTALLAHAATLPAPAAFASAAPPGTTPFPSGPCLFGGSRCGYFPPCHFKRLARSTSI